MAGMHPLPGFRGLRKDNNYAKRRFFSRKKVLDQMCVWQRNPIPRSLFHLSTAYCRSKEKSKQIKGKAVHVFKVSGGRGKRGNGDMLCTPCNMPV